MNFSTHKLAFLASLILTQTLTQSLALAGPVLPPEFVGFEYVENTMVEVNGQKLYRVLKNDFSKNDPHVLFFQDPNGKKVQAIISLGLMLDGTYGLLIEEWREKFPDFFFPSESTQFEGTWSVSEDGQGIVLDFFGTLTATKNAHGEKAAKFQITRDLLSPGLVGSSTVLTPIDSNVKF